MDHFFRFWRNDQFFEVPLYDTEHILFYFFCLCNLEDIIFLMKYLYSKTNYEQKNLMLIIHRLVQLFRILKQGRLQGFKSTHKKTRFYGISNFKGEKKRLTGCFGVISILQYFFTFYSLLSSFQENPFLEILKNSLRS